MNGYVSMIFFSECLLLVYIKVTDICKLVLYPAMSLEVLIICSIFMLDFFFQIGFPIAPGGLKLAM